MEEIHSKAIENLKNYVVMMQTLLVKENRKFDLLMSSGNTGALMIYLAELIYKKLNLEVPPILLLPIQRYKGSDSKENLFDNIVLYPEAEKQLHSLEKINNILFVDDEIYAGNGVKELMKLVIKFKVDNELEGETVCTIVAEDQGLPDSFAIPGVKTELKLFAEGEDGLDNAITYFLPKEIIKPFKEALSNIPTHILINVVFNLQHRIKTMDDSLPKFVNTYNEQSDINIENIKELRDKALNYTNNLINEILT